MQKNLGIHINFSYNFHWFFAIYYISLFYIIIFHLLLFSLNIALSFHFSPNFFVVSGYPVLPSLDMTLILISPLYLLFFMAKDKPRHVSLATDVQGIVSLSHFVYYTTLINYLWVVVDHRQIVKCTLPLMASFLLKLISWHGLSLKVPS